MSNAVITSMPIPVPQTEGAALLAIIERAARDPSMDIDKMERLLTLRGEAEARAARQGFNIAMAAAQAAMGRVSADCSNPQTRSKYASYAALDRALRPVYTEQGFSLSFDTADGAAENCVRIICNVGHRDGHNHPYHIDMPADGKGARGNDVMTKTHATGSAITYGRRYLLLMIFNIAVGTDLDDDGNAASHRQNPHVTRSEDIASPAPPAWRLLQSKDPTKLLKKTDPKQREIGAALQAEGFAIHDVAQLREWFESDSVQERAEVMRQDWLDTISNRLWEHVKDVQALTPSPDEPAP